MTFCEPAQVELHEKLIGSQIKSINLRKLKKIKQRRKIPQTRYERFRAKFFQASRRLPPSSLLHHPYPKNQKIT